MSLLLSGIAQAQDKPRLKPELKYYDNIFEKMQACQPKEWWAGQLESREIRQVKYVYEIQQNTDHCKTKIIMWRLWILEGSTGHDYKLGGGIFLRLFRRNPNLIMHTFHNGKEDIVGQFLKTER